MKGEKDERNIELHMSLYEQYNLPCKNSKLKSKSIAMLPVSPSNGCSSFVSKASSSNVASAEQKVLPTFGRLPGSSHLTETYYCSPMLELENYQNPHASTNLTMKPELNLVQPRGFSSDNNSRAQNPGDEKDYKVPSFLQSGKTINYKNFQLLGDKEKVDPFSSIYSPEFRNGCLKLPKETGSCRNLSDEKNSKLSQNDEKIGEKIISDAEKGRLRDFYAQPRKENKILLKTETVSDDGMSEKVMRKRCASAMEISTKIDWIKEEGSKETDCEALPVGNADKKQDILEFSLGDYKPCLDLTPHDVVRVIGQRLFREARKTIVDQQKIFSFQIFELHRLVKVQKLISRSPEKFRENNFDPNRPSIQFPPMNKLLYVTPLDPSPAVAKPKIDPDKSSGSGTVSEMLPLPKTDTEKRHLAQQPTPKLSTDAKLAPWYFHAPVGNQWLVPLRSPSEGLVYKPYPGPCFPANGFAPPVYGNCGPITFGVPAPYTMPPINASGSNIEAEQIPSGGVQIAELDTNSPTDNANFAIPLEKETEKDALSLFPTTPSFHALEDQKGDDQKAKVIKVVPHSRKSASASAARIFQSIQEERNIHRLSSYTSHVS